MKGIIERIYPNKLQDGREYLTLQINGAKYSLWDKKYFETLNEGMPVSFDFKKSGRYLNISEIEPDLDYKPGNDGNKNPFNYPSPRDFQMKKTSCLKCATYIVKDIPLEVDKKLDVTLDVAKKLEKYLTITPAEEEPALKKSVDPGNFDGEF